jgi:hypothetical protein
VFQNGDAGEEEGVSFVVCEFRSLGGDDLICRKREVSGEKKVCFFLNSFIKIFI